MHVKRSADGDEENKRLNPDNFTGHTAYKKTQTHYRSLQQTQMSRKTGEFPEPVALRIIMIFAGTVLEPYW